MIETPRAAYPRRRDRRGGGLLQLRHQRPHADGVPGSACDDVEPDDAGLPGRGPAQAQPETIDEGGVGELVRIGAARPEDEAELKLGVCGEHGGDPESIDLFYEGRSRLRELFAIAVPIARLRGPGHRRRQRRQQVSPSRETTAGRGGGGPLRRHRRRCISARLVHRSGWSSLRCSGSTCSCSTGRRTRSTARGGHRVHRVDLDRRAFSLVVLLGSAVRPLASTCPATSSRRASASLTSSSWAIIMSFFRVPKMYQHRVLFWGIFGALVMRAVFIFAGVALIERFDWILYVFGVPAVHRRSHARLRRRSRGSVQQPVPQVVHKVVPSTDKWTAPSCSPASTGGASPRRCSRCWC